MHVLATILFFALVFKNINHAVALFYFNPHEMQFLAASFQAGCQPIPANMTLCYGIGYDQMRLPNLLNHDSIQEAVAQSNIWNLLVRTRCHVDLNLFLCSLYAPICLKDHYDMQIIKPCRELCEAVKGKCLPHMQGFGYEWPEIAFCDKFPWESEKMCLPSRSQSALANAATPVTCNACKPIGTYENFKRSYCASQTVFRGRIKRYIPQNQGNTRLIIQKKRKYFKPANLRGNWENNNDESTTDDQKTKFFIPMENNKCSCPLLASSQTNSAWLILANAADNKGNAPIQQLIPCNKDNELFKNILRFLRQDKEADAVCRQYEKEQEVPAFRLKQSSNNFGGKYKGMGRGNRNEKSRKNQRKYQTEYQKTTAVKKRKRNKQYQQEQNSEKQDSNYYGQENSMYVV